MFPSFDENKNTQSPHKSGKKMNELNDFLLFCFFANSYYFVVNSHRGRSFRQGAYIRGAGGV